MPNENSIRSDNNVPSLLAENGGFTKRVQADSNWSLSTWLVWSDGNTISAAYPLPVNTWWVFANMVNVSESDNGWFSWVITDYFDDLTTTNTNASATNPKVINVDFIRFIEVSALWLGCDDWTKSFSNVTFELLWSNDAVILDVTTFQNDNTKRNSQVIPIAPTFCTSINIKFHTADEVGLSNIWLTNILETKSSLQWVSWLTWAVEPIWSFRSALNVHVADVHVEPIMRHFTAPDWYSTTLNSSASIDDTSISVATTTWAVVWNSIRIEEGIVMETDDPIITVIAAWTPWTLTLDRPLDNTYTTAATVDRVFINLNDAAVWSLATPTLAAVAPPVWETWHINRIIITMTHSTAWDDGKFWNLPALTNWVVLRQTTSILWKNTITNWKTNSDMREDMFDIVYPDRSWGWWDFGTSWIYSFDKLSTVIQLNWDDWDKLEIIIQDDITSLGKFSVKAWGHRVDT